MSREMEDLEAKIRTLCVHAWDEEIRWPIISAWRENFTGQVLDQDLERLYGMLSLSKFMYFSKSMVREMLKSLYRDYFESPSLQRIRKNCGGSLDSARIRSLYAQRLKGARFIGVGNPSESGCHLLYYFRQVNNLPKDLFADFHGAFQPHIDRAGLPGVGARLTYVPRDQSATTYVFFDDLVGSGTQVAQYLSRELASARASNPGLEFIFLSLFATTAGLARLNQPSLFDGRATALFELDESFKAFEVGSRFFADPPSWFELDRAREMIYQYGELLYPERGLGFAGNQLLLAFAHNTPDNVPAAFWCPGENNSWSPVFLRYDKNYGGVL